jgi:flagellar motor switch protein FliN
VRSIGLDALGDVQVVVKALVGRATVSVGEVLNYAPGTIVPLDARTDAPVPLLVNGITIACGDLVAMDDGGLAVEIKQIVQPDGRHPSA